MANERDKSNHLLQQFIEIASYITRTDNPFIFYEYYIPGCKSIFDIANTGTIKEIAFEEETERVITSDELFDIINILLKLQQSGVKVESKRIPLLSEQYKFKGFRSVEFSYNVNDSLHVIRIMHKKKEIIMKTILKRACNMNYTVGKGWHPLVDEATERLSKLGVNIISHYEKYGTLRFEVDSEPMEATLILNELEDRSQCICEFCGATGADVAEVEFNGWVKTLCPACTAQWQEQNHKIAKQ